MYQQKIMAENIRRYRLLHGMTQSQLAEKLFVTAQNISKWEKAKSAPDLENLCKLAEVFSVSVDRLLYGSSRNADGPMLAAIDGGGTKTDFVLYTESGEVIKHLRLSCSNPNAVGMERAQAVLKRGLDQLFAENGNISAVYAGIAGCGVKANQRVVRAFLKQTYPGVRFEVQTDILNVIYSAPVGERCIAGICGTGSVVYAKTPEKLVRIGGLGYLFESGCSGYDFGRDALHAALAAKDGFGPQTVLTEMVEKRLGGDPWEKINELYKMKIDEIASFSKLVFDAIAQNDPVAEQILEKNADQFSAMINTAYAHYDCGTDLVIAGGLVAEKQYLEPALKKRISGNLRLIFNEKPQICGAAVGGCRMVGELSDSFLEDFYKNYLKILEENDNAENGNA